MTNKLSLRKIELNSRYLSKKPHFPFIVRMRSNPWTYEFGTWLLDSGKNHKDWEWWWKDSCWRFEFKNEEDKVKFILKWM